MYYLITLALTKETIQSIVNIYTHHVPVSQLSHRVDLRYHGTILISRTVPYRTAGFPVPFSSLIWISSNVPLLFQCCFYQMKWFVWCQKFCDFIWNKNSHRSNRDFAFANVAKSFAKNCSYCIMAGISRFVIISI